jgi:hypothetical protein
MLRIGSADHKGIAEKRGRMVDKRATCGRKRTKKYFLQRAAIVRFSGRTSNE